MPNVESLERRFPALIGSQQTGREGHHPDLRQIHAPNRWRSRHGQPPPRPMIARDDVSKSKLTILRLREETAHGCGLNAPEYLAHPGTLGAVLSDVVDVGHLTPVWTQRVATLARDLFEPLVVLHEFVAKARVPRVGIANRHALRGAPPVVDEDSSGLITGAGAACAESLLRHSTYLITADRRSGPEVLAHRRPPDLLLAFGEARLEGGHELRDVEDVHCIRL